MPCIVEEELIANDVDFQSQLTKSWMYYYNAQVIKEGEVSSSEQLSSLSLVNEALHARFWKNNPADKLEFLNVLIG